MDMPVENEKLIEQAKELDLDIEDFEDEDELQEAIDDKLEEESQDADKLKEKLEFQQKESKKAFDARDRAKKDTRKLKRKMDEQAKLMKEMQDKLDDSPDSETFKELQDKMDALTAADEEKRMSKMDEGEKTKIRFQKQLDDMKKDMESHSDKFTKQLEERDERLANNKTEIKGLREARLGGEIIREAAKHNAYKPEQIEKLLISDFTYDEKLESFSYLERDSKNKIVDEKSVEERVKEFLDDPDNDNLVRSDAKGGTGSKEQGTKSSKAAEDKKRSNESGHFGDRLGGRKPGEYNKKDPELIADADEKGLSVEDHIDILKMRDAKMNKIKGIKEDK
jgi:hypothetical protein